MWSVYLNGDCGLSFHTRLGSIGFGVSGLMICWFEPIGLLLRAHMVLISPCAQEESVPRPMYTRAHHMLLLVWCMLEEGESNVAR
jgi:hypothetical protein